MKIYAGSLQRRGRRYYLVVCHRGRQKWFALKTEKLSVARERAAHLAPADPNHEEAWLEKLVREGEAARDKLARKKAQGALTWENLDDACAQSVDAGIPGERRQCHTRWLAILAERAKRVTGVTTPSLLTPKDADVVTAGLCGSYVSAPRMLGYFHRVWRSLGLDEAVWSRSRGACGQTCAKETEHYRRLSLNEVSRVHAHLTETDAELADMVVLGYSTGLRLSDVAELELSEISLPFLRVRPNKTRRRKPVPLKIPLTKQAEGIVRRLKSSAEKSGNRFLFSEAARHRPSRRIAAAFRAGGVAKEQNGRASFHSLRATFISLMDDAGISPHVTDSVTGHGGGGMHARYTQPSDEALMAAVAKAIPPLARGRGGAKKRKTTT